MNPDPNLVLTAKIFVDARRDGRQVTRYPGVMPETMEDAYAIQDDAIRLSKKPIGGWKVGRIADRLSDKFGTNRLAGPILSPMIVDANEQTDPVMPILQGFAAVEAELMLRIGSAIPAGTSVAGIAEHIDEVRFGFEIASSPFPEINEHGPAVTASDFGNNFGLVLGPHIADWRAHDLINAPVSLSIEDEVVGTGSCASMLDGPFGSVAFLADLLSSRGIELPVGTWVSTGAITGVHRINSGQRASAVFDHKYEIACRTRAFAPAAIKEGARQ